MDFQRRKDTAKPIVDYLKGDSCSIENLLGLKDGLQALDVAVDNRLKKLVKQRDKLQSKIKVDDEHNWLD